MPKHASKQCEENSIFNSDQKYRDRLTQEVLSVLGARDPERKPLRQELLQLIDSPIYSDNEPAVMVGATHAQLSEKLLRHPDLQSRLSQLTEYSTSKWLLEQELISRGKIDAELPGDAYKKAKDVAAIGVCFSGGGIRSATFNLGMLQGLAQLGKLGLIDYLSTVSGGGYIHQFLAAWIKNEQEVTKDGFAAVEEKLVPIPDCGSDRIIPPEPIRWLRRYSNYLSPSVSVFGADVWTMIEVWIRNTALNLTILITAIMSVMLLPHIALTEWGLSLHMPASFAMRVVVYLVLVIVALFAIALLAYSFPRYCAKAEHEGQLAGGEDSPKDKTRIWHPYAIALAWLIVSAFTSGIVYRLSLPGGSPYSRTAARDYAPRQMHPSADPTGAFQVSVSTPAAALSVRSAATGATTTPDTKRQPSRIGLAWKDKPSAAIPRLGPVPIPLCSQPRVVYALHGITHANQTSEHCRPDQADMDQSPALSNAPADWKDETPLLWLYESFPFLCAFFCGALWFSRKETVGPVANVLSFFCPVFSVGFSIALIFVIEHLFFALSFAAPKEYVMALGVAVLPSVLLAVPFVTLEFYGGLMGTLYASAQREWVARLRAVSFQIGIIWIALCGIALIGPHFVEWIGDQVVLKYAVWSTWLVSSVSGVILAKSRSTSGKPKDPDDPGASSGHSLQEFIVKVAPPLFMVGLFLLLSDLAGWLLAGDHVGQPHESSMRWCVLLAVLFLTSTLFAWRVDINEFSMNSFYRDRLARCYAGASNRERKPNRFTGFDYRDNSWRVTGLLPKTWNRIDGPSGTYDGPFPIFCTALNITTGRELAYQERKAASFAITPLYTGYSTGWTDATSPELQYNGFVPTACHIKRNSDGITMSSAVAISGAAASPNMGFHSSPPMAFLMTVFNVRLGWWLRNTRHRTALDSPRFGLFYLIRELFGAVDDTSRYVYLSDGGHFENMGLYELLRRRCRTVIVCDAEADGDLCFEGFGMAIRKARIDFGVEIRVTGVIEPPSSTSRNDGSSATLDPGRSSPTGAEGLLEFKHFPGNLFHALTCEIYYPEDNKDDSPALLLYVKSTLTGDEPADVLNYHRVHPSFPFDTTLNQFFTESQFESYRRLGEHILLRPEISEWIRKHVVRARHPQSECVDASATD